MSLQSFSSAVSDPFIKPAFWVQPRLSSFANIHFHVFICDYFHFSFLFSLLSHTASICTGSQQMSLLYHMCPQSAVLLDHSLIFYSPVSIKTSSATGGPRELPWLFSYVWELTHLSSWMPTSLKQETVFKHWVWDEHTAACLYSYRHACQIQIIGYLSIYLHEKSEELSTKAETLLFRG